MAKNERKHRIRYEKVSKRSRVKEGDKWRKGSKGWGWYRPMKKKRSHRKIHSILNDLFGW